ncbi:CAP domain-containing protein [Oleiphilus sp. HI0080]|uniref:CAP domain-containing protein n=2 Tax=Oleiphilus sp. HI0080 TaxID=1822255 RepID=UPI000ADE4B68|nr:CAP domain-containing protein [Oleiphilus sp. HI0080]
MSTIQNFYRLVSASTCALVLSACSSGAYDSTSEVNSLSETGATSQGQGQAVAAQLMDEVCLTSQLDDELLVALNAARAQSRSCGAVFYEAVGPVTWNCQLEAAGLTHSTDMGDNNFFSHTGSNGLRVGSRATQAGYSWNMVGENIAAGFYSVDSVMQGWLDSPSHCSAIMNGHYEEGAVAVYIADNADYEVYWTMVLGHPIQ